MDTASTAISLNTSKAEKARIALLQDLHRPLEEHWAGNKSGLDAMVSDYVYKHHITRMEGIYNSTDVIHIDNETPQGPANVTPMSQLYGYGGLMRSGGKEEIYNTRREGNWDPYHSTVSRINPCIERKSAHATPTSRRSPGRPPSPASTNTHSHTHARAPSPRNNNCTNGYRSNSLQLSTPVVERTARRGRSPSPVANGGIRATDPHTEYKLRHQQQYQEQQLRQYQQQQYQEEQEQEQEQIDKTRHRSDDASMSTNELLLTGTYKLTPQQHNAYQTFVHLLIEHDTTDQLKIIEDAFKDAQVESLLSNFSGT